MNVKSAILLLGTFFPLAVQSRDWSSWIKGGYEQSCDTACSALSLMCDSSATGPTSDVEMNSLAANACQKYDTAPGYYPQIETYAGELWCIYSKTGNAGGCSWGTSSYRFCACKAIPTADPTSTPTADPTSTPTAVPTSPSAEPTSTPTADPTADPTSTPTADPTSTPTAVPTMTTTTKAPSISSTKKHTKEKKSRDVNAKDKGITKFPITSKKPESKKGPTTAKGPIVAKRTRTPKDKQVKGKEKQGKGHKEELTE